MRIIGGLAKGRNLLSPVGMGTRPTLDRIKESIFNIIQNYTYGAVVVDVFSGTGSLGLEAVSRGAKECHLIDKGDETFALLKKNVETLKFQDKCQCYNIDSYKALELFAQKKMVFDIIFIDPPYLREMIPPAIHLITKGNLLAPKGIIASKIDSSEEIFQGNEEIVLTDYRKYGNTTVCFYKHKE